MDEVKLELSEMLNLDDHRRLDGQNRMTENRQMLGLVVVVEVEVVAEVEEVVAEAGLIEVELRDKRDLVRARGSRMTTACKGVTVPGCLFLC